MGNNELEELSEDEMEKILKEVREWPEDLICPITFRPIKEAVVCLNNEIYEKNAIEEWLKINDSSPLTGRKICNQDVLPAVEEQNRIKELIKNKINFIKHNVPIFLKNNYVDEAQTMLLETKNYWESLSDKLKQELINLDYKIKIEKYGLARLQEKYRITLINGQVEEDGWEYIPELKGVTLVEGKVTYPSGYMEEGKWEYNKELKACIMTKGKVSYPDGRVEDGKRKYNRKLKIDILVEGKVAYEDKNPENGRLEQNIETKKSNSEKQNHIF